MLIKKIAINFKYKCFSEKDSMKINIEIFCPQCCNVKKSIAQHVAKTKIVNNVTIKNIQTI